MKRSILSLFLALCFLVALVPQSVGTASATGSCGENLSWSLDQETGTLTISGSGDMYDFDPWADTAAPWYAERASITNVVIGEEVTGIGEYAFASCFNLKDIFIPANVQRIGVEAFWDAHITAYTVAEDSLYFSNDAYGVLFNKDKTVLVDFPDEYAGSYSIPEGVEILEDSSFWNCNDLTELTVPGTVKTMEFAIGYCESLETVTFLEGITKISSRALIGCSSLYRIQLPNSLKTIDHRAFSRNDGLTSLILPAGVEQIAASLVLDCNNLQQLTILNPECEVYDAGTGIMLSLPVGSVICGYAGSTAQTIAEEFGYSFLEIPDAPLSGTCGEELTWSFDYATGTLTIEGRGDMYDYDYTDEGSAPWAPIASIINNIELGKELTSIGEFAFMDCYHVSMLEIPEGVTRIGYNALIALLDLREVRVAEGNPAFTSDPYGVLYTKDMKELVLMPCLYEGTYTVPHGVETIASNAIANCRSLTGLILPGTLQNCISGILANNLTWVEFSEGITYIDAYAVTTCSSLKNIFLPNTLTVIDAYAFYNNRNLTEVVIPESVEQINKGAFDSCVGLESITILNPACVIYSEDDTATTLGTPGTTVIYGHEGSTAMFYAEKYGYGFIPLETAPTVDESIAIRHTLNLGSNIAINYVVDGAQLEGYDSYDMICKLPVYEGNELVSTETVVVEPEMRDGLCYFVLDELNALQMMNEVTAYLYLTKGEQNYTSNTDTYSIATYAYNQLNKATTSNALKAVCANLLRYGGVAQAWKGYRTDALAHDNMTDAHLNYVSDLESVEFGQNNRVIPNLEDPTVTFAGKSLILDSSIIARFILDTTAFEGDPDELSVYVRYTDIYGQTRHIVHSKGCLVPYDTSRNLYAFDFDYLRATELRSPLLIEVRHNDTTVSQTLEYSVDTYGNGKTGDILSLMQAVMAYSDSAKAYFTETLG